jgi:hypothetical protein
LRLGFVIAFWRICTIIALKSLIDNSNICAIVKLALLIIFIHVICDFPDSL